MDSSNELTSLKKSYSVSHNYEEKKAFGNKKENQKTEFNRENYQKRTTSEMKSDNKVKVFLKNLLKSKDEMTIEESQKFIDGLLEQAEIQKEMIKNLTFERENLKELNLAAEEMITFQQKKIKDNEEKIKMKDEMLKQKDNEIKQLALLNRKIVEKNTELSSKIKKFLWK